MFSHPSALRILVTLGGLVALVALSVIGPARLPRARPDQPERWFAPGQWGHEPGRPVPRVNSGAYLTRHIGGLSSPDVAAWARHNRLTAPLNFSHHLSEVIPASLFGTHPEYFPLVNGQRERPPANIVNWNPDLGRADVAAHAARVAREAFVADPGLTSFALGVNDGLNFGESPETLAAIHPLRWFRGRPDFSDLVFGFMNRAAEDLARTHPDKYLGALAYYWAENAPRFPVHPQVVPFLTADRSQGYDPAFLREEAAVQRRWAEAGPRRLGLYDYLFGVGFMVPRIHPHLIAENLRQARTLGFTDYYCEATPNWGIDGPMTWLVAQLLAEPNQNVDALLDEYYRRYFQESAVPLRHFFERCEEQWMRQGGPSYWLKYFRDDSQADLFPSAVCAELRQLLEEGARLARSVKVRERVALVAASFGVTERYVLMHEARAGVAVATLKGQMSGREGAESLTAYLEAKSEFVRYSRETTTRYPLSFSQILYDDFLLNNPAFCAAAALEQSGFLAPATASDQLMTELERRAEPGVADGLALARATLRGDTVEVLTDGGFEGPLQAGKKIGGLTYGVDLPGTWRGKVEPTETHAAVVSAASARTGLAGLRISGAVSTTVFQWRPAKPDRLYVASVFTRARVSSSDAVYVQIGWLDAHWQRLAKTLYLRLPAGEWPEWVALRQGGRAPPGAAWVGVGILLKNQLPGDWAEFDDFSLREVDSAK